MSKIDKLKKSLKTVGEWVEARSEDVKEYLQNDEKEDLKSVQQEIEKFGKTYLDWSKEDFKSVKKSIEDTVAYTKRVENCMEVSNSAKDCKQVILNHEVKMSGEAQDTSHEHGAQEL